MCLGIMLVLVIIFLVFLKRRFKSIPYKRAKNEKEESSKEGAIVLQAVGELQGVDELPAMHQHQAEDELQAASECQTAESDELQDLCKNQAVGKLQAEEHNKLKETTEARYTVTGILDTVKWKYDLQEATNRTFKEIDVTEDCELRDCIGQEFKRGCVYYEFYHEEESIFDYQELIFMKKVCHLFFKDSHPPPQNLYATHKFRRCWLLSACTYSLWLQ